MCSLRSLVSPLLLSALVLACGGAPPAAPSSAPPSQTTAAPSAPASAAAQAKAAEVKAPGEAKVGDRTTCPTSGEEFTVTAASPKFEYKGKTYYFCCSGCDRKFASDPEKYLQKKPDA